MKLLLLALLALCLAAACGAAELGRPQTVSLGAEAHRAHLTLDGLSWRTEAVGVWPRLAAAAPTAGANPDVVTNLGKDRWVVVENNTVVVRGEGPATRPR